MFQLLYDGSDCPRPGALNAIKYRQHRYCIAFFKLYDSIIANHNAPYIARQVYSALIFHLEAPTFYLSVHR